MTEPANSAEQAWTVDDLVTVAKSLRRAFILQNVMLAVLAVLSTLAIAGIGVVTWDNHVNTAKLQQVTAENQAAIEASERQWCPVLGALITGPQSTTARGEWIREVFTQLFSDYGCTPADLEDIPDAPTPSPSPDQS